MPAWSPEEALEKAKLGGANSAARRRARREMSVTDPEALLKDVLSPHVEKVGKELLRAAGLIADDNNHFRELDSKERLSALKTVIEYAVGRPATRRVDPGKPPAPEASSLRIQ